MRIVTIMLGAALLLGVAGCGNGQGKNGPAHAKAAAEQTADAPGQAAAESKAEQAIVSRSVGFGKVNPAPYGRFAEPRQIDAFAEAIQSAEQIQGVLDVAQPDYDVVLQHDGKRQDIHLWLDTRSEHGMFTYVSDTGTGYRLTTGSTRELMELIWGIRYDSKQAAANGDIVNLIGRIENPATWERFMQNVKSGGSDAVQVVHYTIEGDPIFDDLSFDGRTIAHRFDNTHDAYGSPAKRLEYCQSIEEMKTEKGTVYTLAACGEDGKRSETFQLSIR
ncbi:DUF4362 domain-containing protein [Paenibacillus lycopersici]|uniref:DUF4362 domain-containing protein n=1 Tax=Paenibacillus lycopersici TaxID=2704462 RepID=A0A6C0G516_9BACL|nr:DUF4362 domain-containing protein [Paenibacillus lycopersici]QHT62584.1 DUF4362 domain-containing protein [Paenibacillus lycopersici]